MNELQFTEYVNNQIAKHCPAFTFGFDNAVTRYGYCNYTFKRISISKKMFKINSFDNNRTVLLHEIAHAITGKKNGHNRVWSGVCKKIGGDGKRLYSNKQVTTVAKKFTGTCPICHRVIHRHRRKAIACGVCCRKHNSSRFDEKYLFTWK